MVTVAKLASRRLKHNKSRSALTVVALVLIATLLTALGSAAIGMVDFQRKTISFDVGNAHATYRWANMNQVQLLEQSDEIEALFLKENFAEVVQDKLNAGLNFDSVRKDGIALVALTEGRMPEEAHEIAGPPSLFERLGVEPALGNIVTISFRVHGEGEVQTRDFTITGLQEQADLSVLNVSDSRIAFGAAVSEKLVQEYLREEERYFNARIRVAEEGRSFEEIETQIMEIGQSVGMNEKDVSLNSVYLMWMTDPSTGTMLAMAALGLLVILLGGMVIYNIYYVSVISNIQELGKLKALGATRTQMKQLLLTEGLRLAAVSIPIGLLLGYGCAFGLFAFMSAGVNKDIGAVRIFSLPVLFVVVLAVLATVILSLMKPMRMAGKISPVEAMRYQEQSADSKSQRRGFQTISLTRLSVANLARNKKRTTATIVTLGLTCVLFLGIATVLNNMNVEDYARQTLTKGEFMLSLNYSLNDTAYPENNLDVIQLDNPLNEETVNRILSMDGVTQVMESNAVSATILHPGFPETERYAIGAFGRTDETWLQDKVRRGEVEYNAMTAENGLVFNWEAFFDEYGLEIGETVPMVIHAGGADIPFTGVLHASSTVSRNEFWITEDLMSQITPQSVRLTEHLYICVEESAYDQVKAELQALEGDIAAVSMLSLDEELRIAQAALQNLKYPVYGLLLIVGVISFMSLINTMVTSILTRKKELGILQAIGLTDKQLRSMLQKEGLVLTGGALAVGLTAGNLLGWIVVAVAGAADVITVTAYHYPVWETLILIAAMTVGQLFVTLFISRYIHKETLVERMRSQD